MVVGRRRNCPRYHIPPSPSSPFAFLFWTLIFERLSATERMANPPRNSTRIKPTPTGKKMTKGNAKVLPSVTTANVNDTLREGQENLPPVSHLTSTPRSGIVVNSSPLSAAQKTPLRTSRASVTVNHQSGGGHVISQPASAMRTSTTSSQLKDLQGQFNNNILLGDERVHLLVLQML